MLASTSVPLITDTDKSATVITSDEIKPSEKSKVNVIISLGSIGGKLVAINSFYLTGMIGTNLTVKSLFGIETEKTLLGIETENFLLLTDTL